MEKIRNLLNSIFEIYKITYLSTIFQKDIDVNNLKIIEIYKKYNVINIDELVSLVNRYSLLILDILDNIDIDFVRLIISLILDKNKRKILSYDDTIFKKIYEYIVKNNLYDPNWSIGTSNEPLYTMLPNSADLYNINLKVFNNSSLDWNILHNGTDSFIYFLNKYLYSDNEEEKLYLFEIIKIAIQNIDFYSTKRYKASNKKICYEIMPIGEYLKEYCNDVLDGKILNLMNQKIFLYVKAKQKL